jgi:hypothetical protein
LQATASTDLVVRHPLRAHHLAHRKAVTTIDGWSVVGHDRISGTLLDRPGGRRKKKIITSPVVWVRWIEGAATALVHTRSGSDYLLARPAESFGSKRAAWFLRVKAAPGHEGAVVHSDRPLRTELTELTD